MSEPDQFRSTTPANAHGTAADQSGMIHSKNSAKRGCDERCHGDAHEQGPGSDPGVLFASAQAPRAPTATAPIVAPRPNPNPSTDPAIAAPPKAPITPPATPAANTFDGSRLTTRTLRITATCENQSLTDSPSGWAKTADGGATQQRSMERLLLAGGRRPRGARGGNRNPSA